MVPWCFWILPARRLCKVRCFLFRKCYLSRLGWTGQQAQLTEGTFKQRYTQHKSTFTHRKLSNSTELSKYIWQLKDSNTSFTTKWSINARARPYHNSSKRCDLCLAEKLYIIKRSNNNLLNKRSELVSKCGHENKFYLKNNWRSSYTIAIVLRSSTFSADSFTSHPTIL